MLLLPFAAAVFAVAIAAGAEAQTPVMRDSAGVRIIENAKPTAAGGRWATLHPEHTVEIGALDGPEAYLFTGSVQAFETRTGEIVVVDADFVGAPYDIRVFDDTGAHLRTFGGKGAGPGEFRAGPRVRLVPPDTVLAWDASLGRLTWFALDGTIAREETVRTTPPIPMIFSPQPWAVLPDGNVVLMTLGRAPERPERVRLRFIRKETSLMVRPAGSQKLLEFGDFRGHAGLYAGSGVLVVTPELFSSVTDRWGVRVTTPPSIVVANDPDGSWVLAVFRLDGSLTTSIRAAVPRREVSADIARQERNRLIQSTASFPATEQAAFRSVIRDMPMPDSTPAIGRVIVDDSNRVWVQRWSGGWEEGGVDRYDVIDASGVWLGWVEVNRSFGQIVSIGDDHIVFVWTDELDVPYVRRHAFSMTE